MGIFWLSSYEQQTLGRGIIIYVFVCLWKYVDPQLKKDQVYPKNTFIADNTPAHRVPREIKMQAF